MADPAAILCQGTTMTFNAVAVGGLMAISGIGSGSASEIETTTFASSAKEFVQGLRDFGSVTIDLRRNQDDLGQAEMFSAMASQLTRTVIITLPSSTANVATFQAFVQSLSTDLKADGAVEGKAVLRITGAVAWT
jgi:hypothetical protein